jgi:hypothetical protein
VLVTIASLIDGAPLPLGVLAIGGVVERPVPGLLLTSTATAAARSLGSRPHAVSRPTRETAGDAADVFGARVDAPEGDVDDEIIVRALSAFMDARERYIASLGARYGITLDSGSRPTHAHHSVLEVARRFGLTA